MCFHHQDPIYKTPMSSRHFHQQKKEATVPTSPCPTDMSFPLLWGESFQFDTCLQAGSGYRWGVAKTSSGSVGVAVTSNEVWSLVKKRKKIQKIPEKSILVGRCRCMTCFFFCLWSFFWVPMFFFFVLGPLAAVAFPPFRCEGGIFRGKYPSRMTRHIRIVDSCRDTWYGPMDHVNPQLCTVYH